MREFQREDCFVKRKDEVIANLDEIFSSPRYT